MFELMPFRNRRRSNVIERSDEPFSSMLSGFIDDMMEIAGSNFRADIKENESEYIIEAELPGMKKEDIQLDINNDYLIISAEKEEESEEKTENYICRERRKGSCRRSFYLSNVDQENIKAEYNEGVLKVHLPKEEEAPVKNRSIDIE